MAQAVGGSSVDQGTEEEDMVEGEGFGMLAGHTVYHSASN